MNLAFTAPPRALLLALLLALALPLPAPAPAQDDGGGDEGSAAGGDAERPANPAIESGVSFVNINRIFKESAYIQAQLDAVNAEFSDREEALREMNEELIAARDEHSRNRLTMTAENLSAENERLNAMELEINREGRNLTEDKRLRFDSAQRDLERLVLETIQEVSAGRENFIVFDLSTILFADKRLEITDEVIVRLDETAAAMASESGSDSGSDQ